MSINFHANSQLEPKEVKKWIVEFVRALKASFEFELEVHGSSEYDSSDEVVWEARRLLSPTNSYYQVGEYGAFDVRHDFSLSMGFEVPTVARRVNFELLRDQYKRILERLSGIYPTVSSRCGGHIHILAGYHRRGSYDDSLEFREIIDDIPGVIVDNVWQIYRRYLPAIYWITSTVPGPMRITRSAEYRQWQQILQNTAVRRSMYHIVDRISSRYVGLNFTNSVWEDQNMVRVFHLENRIPDGNMSPSAIAAFACMSAAIVIKAVKLSRWGIMLVGNRQRRELVRSLMRTVIDNPYDDIVRPFTEGRDTDVLTNIRELAHEFVSFIGPELRYFDESDQALEILTKLAHTPISLMRMSGEESAEWSSVEEQLSSSAVLEDDEGIANIIKSVDLCLHMGKSNFEEWCQSVANSIGMEPDRVKETIMNLGFTFNSNLGSVVRV